MRLNLEELESRFAPSASVVQTGAAVTVYGDPQKSNFVKVEQINNNIGDVKISLNGAETVYTGVNHLTLIGGDINDTIINNTAVDSYVYGLDGNDGLYGGYGNDLIVGGAGNDSMMDLVGDNFIYGNDDQDVDFVYTNKNGHVFLGANDHLADNPNPTFLVHETLYLLAPPVSSEFFVGAKPGTVFVVYDLGDGLGRRLDTFGGRIDNIVFVGGAGDDLFVNDTAINDFVDGGAGNDILFGGHGASSIVRGGTGNNLVF